MGETGHGRGGTARRRDRLLPLVVVLVGAVVAVVAAAELADRVRSETPVSAVAVGEVGCVTAARYVDPAGTPHLVDLRAYNGACRDGDPGEPVTVFYDADDPGTNAATRSWWWPALTAVVGAALAALGVRGLVLGPAPARPPGRRRALRLPRLPRPRRAEPPPTRFLEGDDADGAYRWDYALGRTAVVIDRVRAERARPAQERTSGAGDGVLDLVEHHLERMLACLRNSTLTSAEAHGRTVSRLVMDGMGGDSPLAEEVGGLVRRLFD